MKISSIKRGFFYSLISDINRPHKNIWTIPKMIPIVNTDWLGAFTIKIVSNAKAIIQAVILSFKFFIVVWGFNYFYKYIIKNPHSEGFYKKYLLKLFSFSSSSDDWFIHFVIFVMSVNISHLFTTHSLILTFLTTPFFFHFTTIILSFWVRCIFLNKI